MKTETLVQFDFKKWRQAAGFTSKDVAYLLGISATQVWRLEKETAIPKIYMWAAKGVDIMKGQI